MVAFESALRVNSDTWFEIVRGLVIRTPGRVEMDLPASYLRSPA